MADAGSSEPEGALEPISPTRWVRLDNYPGWSTWSNDPIDMQLDVYFSESRGNVYSNAISVNGLTILLIVVNRRARDR
jgi:hypothetical protein